MGITNIHVMTQVYSTQNDLLLNNLSRVLQR